MTTLAIIGGTGLTQLSDLNIIKREQLSTPYGSPSAEFVTGELNGQPGYIPGPARQSAYHRAAQNKLPGQYLGT